MSESVSPSMSTGNKDVTPLAEDEIEEELALKPM